MTKITIKLLNQLDESGYTCLIGKSQSTGASLFSLSKEDPEVAINSLSVLPFEEDQLIIIKDALENLTDEDLNEIYLVDQPY